MKDYYFFISRFTIEEWIMADKEKMNCIKDVLKEQGRSQNWLSERIDKSYVVVTNYCNNKKQPTIKVLRKIALVLDVDVKDLLVSTKEQK